MNDAVGLVLFNTFAKFIGHEQNVKDVALAAFEFIIDFVYLAFGSSILGISFGAASAYLFKIADMTGILELSIFVLMIYFPFFAAETLRLSGIVTILFSGISTKRYTEPNLTETTKNSADSLFRVSAHIAESAIFLELGLSLFGIPRGITHVGFIALAFVSCLVGRALNVYPISFMINRKLVVENNMVSQEPVNAVSSLPNRISLSQDSRIEMKTSHMLWYSGLRGAVAYACAKSFPNDLGHQSEFVATTMWIILITIFLFGSTTFSALKFLQIESDIDENQYFLERPNMNDNGFLKRLGECFILYFVLLKNNF